MTRRGAVGAGLGNIMDAMKKAQEFTSVAKDLQEQLKNTEIEASVRDGQVTVTMTAQQVPLKVEVTDDLVAKGSAEVRGVVRRNFVPGMRGITGLFVRSVCVVSCVF